MGMDGLSFANTGAIKESTSAEYTAKTEQTMHADATNDSKQVQSTSVNQRVRSKDEEEESQKRKQQGQEEQEEEIFDDGMPEPSEAELTDFESDVQDIENPNKDFYVKLNVKDDIIELYDSSTNKMIEAISGNELGELVQKLNMASGIFVNKKV